ncbi:MAG: VWA domain-containing protein [Treponema sp.]|jgi:Mg-chelatase subunit ChlD|nr:VWA domain-containing protein [Treponema sp.]
MKRYRLLPAMLVLILFPGPAPAQSRDAAGRDLCVILDVSGSMNEERKFINVQDYLEAEINGGLLRPGDRFTLITFGDSAEERFSRPLGSEADRAALLEDLRKLEAGDGYTDIGMALEKLAELLERRREPGVRQLILFITDGKNTPPPHSPYAGKDLALDERFRSIGEKISRSGWFLYVIGIGAGTDAEKIAQAVEGSAYQETGAELSGLRLDAYAERVDEAAAALAEDAAAAGAGGAALPGKDAAAGEAGGRASAEGAGPAVSALLNRAAAALRIPAPVLAGAAGLALLLSAALLILLVRALFPLTLTLSDGRDTLERKLAPFGGITLNSAAAALGGIGAAGAGLFRIERGLLGLKLRVLDGGGFSDKSPYGKAGAYPLKQRELYLKNGRKITVIAG